MLAFVQEELIPFFQNVRFSKEATTALQCMHELSEQLAKELPKIDPYFEKLAQGVDTWCECWEALST